MPCACFRNPRFAAAAKFLLCAALITLVAAIFGGYSVVSSAVFHNSSVNPLVYAFLRDCIGTTLLLGAAAFTERGKKREDGSGPTWALDVNDFFKFFLLGLTGVYGSQAMSALTIKETTATFFSSMSNLQPAWTCLLAIFLGLERFKVREPTSWGKIAGILTTVSAAVALVLTSSQAGSNDVRSESLNFGLGLFYLALQILLGGALGPTQKPMYAKYSPLALAGNGYAVGTGLLLMIVICSATTAADWNLTPECFLGIAYAGVLSSGLAYGIMSFVNSKLGPAFVAAFLPTQSLFAALFAWIFNGKTLPPVGLVMAVLMIIGVLIIVGCQYLESRMGLLSPYAMAEAAAKGKRSGDGGAAVSEEASLNQKLLGGGPGGDATPSDAESVVATSIDLPTSHYQEENIAKAWR
jgi:drug/metabolite transporter (DMT)-like permease